MISLIQIILSLITKDKIYYPIDYNYPFLIIIDIILECLGHIISYIFLYCLFLEILSFFIKIPVNDRKTNFNFSNIIYCIFSFITYYFAMMLII